jgi:hypothetical protein
VATDDNLELNAPAVLHACESDRPSCDSGGLGPSNIRILAHYADKRGRAVLQAAWDQAIREAGPQGPFPVRLP